MHSESAPSAALPLLAILTLMWAAPLRAQPAGPKVIEQSRTTPVTSPADAELTAETINERSKAIESATDLDDAAKARLKDLYQQASQQLDKIAAFKDSAAVFGSRATEAATALRATNQELAKPPAEIDLSAFKEKKLEDLRKSLSDMERDLESMRRDLSATEGESQRRAARRSEIPTRITAARKLLGEIDEQLKATQASTDPPLALLARQTLLLARKQAAASEIDALEKELAAYDAQGDLPRLQRELLDRQVGRLDERVKQLRQLVDERRRRDADSQAEQAKTDLESAPDELKPLALDNLDRAKQRITLAEDIRTLTAATEAIERDLAEWSADFKRTQNSLGKGTSTTIGLMLRKKRSALPRTRGMRRVIADRQQRIREVQAELFELEERRLDLADIPSIVKPMVAAAAATSPEANVEQLASRLTALFTAEKQILNDLIGDHNRYFELLVRANTSQDELVDTVDQYHDFIDERVFWIRSASVLSISDLEHGLDAGLWLLRPSAWQGVGETLLSDLQKELLLDGLAVLAFAVLIYYRIPIRARIADLAGVSTRESCRRMAPTFHAMLLTFLAATPWPLLFGFLGWRLRSSSSSFDLAVSAGLITVAVVFLPLEVFRQVCRYRGLAESHFRWTPRVLGLLRPILRWLVFLGLPLVFVTAVFEGHDNELYKNSLGRISFILSCVVVAISFQRIFRPDKGVLAETLAAHPGGWLDRLRRVWHWLIVAAPLTAVVLAIVGYYYTALNLNNRFYASILLLVALSLVGSMLYRWVVIQGRRLALQQAVELHAQKKIDEPVDALSVGVFEDQAVNLTEIDLQTRKLVRTSLYFIGVIGLWFIWGDVIPALNFLDELKLWRIDVGQGEEEWVTTQNLVFATFALIATLIAARNVPGLIEIVLLERLPLDSSIRYAITTLSQYAIVSVGALVCSGALGVSWSKAGWLVAALGVGLGFGLQEIFANFVSGVILLFERPIRIGDVITLGDVSGVVTRIRIRATTIRNWDRQELIVPNKDLITGRLLNWTLTDRTNRIVINIGVAYGTNTRRVKALLLEILNKHGNVLSDPPPLVSFEQFGDSSLNFVMRAYLDKLDVRIDTIHDLHTTMHERFAEEGLEIAFPQRDLHVRSMPTGVNFEIGKPASPAADATRDGGSGHKTPSNEGTPEE